MSTKYTNWITYKDEDSKVEVEVTTMLNDDGTPYEKDFYLVLVIGGTTENSVHWDNSTYVKKLQKKLLKGKYKSKIVKELLEDISEHCTTYTEQMAILATVEELLTTAMKVLKRLQ